MSSVFEISVIIPVYNCEKFIEKAIISALQQPEVIEVVLVNDGSTDNTIKIVERLQKSNKKIKIYHHNRKVNKGRSASRNLGIKMATANFIAFLDADDYYLEDRFKNDLKIFSENLNVEGVYNIVGFHFYRETTDLELERLTLSSVTEPIESNMLFNSLMSGKKGDIHLNGLIVKKSVFKKTGMFNTKLKVGEDTNLVLKMALTCNLQTGVIEKPVAIRGVHENNIFNNRKIYGKYHIKIYESLIIWSAKNNISYSKIDKLLSYLFFIHSSEKNGLLKDFICWCKIFSYPKLLLSFLSIKYFPLTKLLNKKVAYIKKIISNEG